MRARVSIFRRGRRAVACALAWTASASAAPLDFELATLGGEWLQLSRLPPAVTVVNFWRSDCPPCRRELPLLRDLESRRPDVRVVAVALQGRNETETYAQSVDLPRLLMIGPTVPAALLRRFGDPAGALPHTVVLDDNREPCSARTGEVDSRWLEQAIEVCGITRPPARR